MYMVLERLKCRTVRKSTAKNYLSVWRHFNKFIIRLDYRPLKWEDRVALFCAYLIQKGLQSSTIKSYISAIKKILKDDGYIWDDKQGLLSSLTQACKLQNDKIKCRLPIQRGLLNLLLFELQRVLSPSQNYLLVLYRALFALAYYGLMRIGELAEGDHSVKAGNIEVALNKYKIKVILYTSKTHGQGSYPQKIKIQALDQYFSRDARRYRVFCPFLLVHQFLVLRGGFELASENLFLFRDGSKVFPHHVRTILRQCINNLGLDGNLYDCHSFRIGKTCDMFKDNIPFHKILAAGRWHSNAIYRYLRSV